MSEESLRPGGVLPPLDAEATASRALGAPVVNNIEPESEPEAEPIEHSHSAKPKRRAPKRNHEPEYSLSGPRNAPGPGDRKTYVQQGYRELNPWYEPQETTENFSLGSNLPHRVRGWQKMKRASEKGETEPATQVENIDGSNDEETLAASEDQREPGPPNPWFSIREKLRDPLGEWLGTTVVMLFGVGVNLGVATGGSSQNGLMQNEYWGWGLATMMGIYIAGGSSGAHLNPGISIMLSAWRGFPARKLPMYMIFQLLGAFTGGLIAICVYRDTILHLEGAFIPSSTGTYIFTQPKDYIKPATAFFTEALGSGLIAGSVLALGDDSNSPPGAGMHAFIIGLLGVVTGMALGSISGGCFNPVRDLGPRLAAIALGYPAAQVFEAYYSWWIWGPWGANILGALLGAAVYDTCIFKGAESPTNFTLESWEREGHRAGHGFAYMLGGKKRTSSRNVESKLEGGEFSN